MAYNGESDLVNALGRGFVTAAFDDNGDGVADPAPMQAALDFGDAQVNSYLEKLYPMNAWPLASVPIVVKQAALEFSIAFAMRRRPEISQALGQDWKPYFDAATELMKRFVENRQELPNTSGEPVNTRTRVSTMSAEEEATGPMFIHGIGDFSR